MPLSDEPQDPLRDAKESFTLRFRAGEDPDLTEHVSEAPPEERERAFSELLTLKVKLLREAGDRPSVSEYLDRYPDRSSAVREAFETLDRKEATPVRRDSSAGGPGLHVRCPHCQNPIELVPDAELESIACPSCGSDFSLVNDEPVATGAAREVTRVGHFELVERVGMGAFGAVWKARDTKLQRTVAVKIPRKGQFDAAQEKMFLREAQNAAQLSHPGVVPVYEVGRDGDTLFIVSEYVRGLTLADWLTGQQPTAREAADLCRQIADALQHAHERGVVHRDLKPGNVLLDDELRPRLMDFGLAKRDAGEITMTLDGQVLGTPAYMSPEQARGDAKDADARSDLYSLGVMLFQLLTGELPFRGNTRMLLHQVLNEEPPSPRKLNSAVPRDLETITLKCLQKEPGKRFKSATALRDDLDRWLGGESIAARPVGRAERVWRWCKRNPTVARLSTVVVMLVLAGLYLSAVVALAKVRRAQTLSELLEVAKRARVEEQRSAERLRELLQREAEASAKEKQAREEAESAETRSAQVLDFLTGTFTGDDGQMRYGYPGEEGRQLYLQQVAAGIDSSLKDQPLVAAQTWEAIAEALGDSRNVTFYSRPGGGQIMPHEAYENAHKLFSAELADSAPDVLRTKVLALAHARDERRPMPGRHAPENSSAELIEAYAKQAQVMGEEHPESVASLRLLAQRLDAIEGWRYRQKLYEYDSVHSEPKAALSSARSLVEAIDPKNARSEDIELAARVLEQHRDEYGLLDYWVLRVWSRYHEILLGSGQADDAALQRGALRAELEAGTTDWGLAWTATKALAGASASASRVEEVSDAFVLMAAAMDEKRNTENVRGDRWNGDRVFPYGDSDDTDEAFGASGYARTLKRGAAEPSEIVSLWATALRIYEEHRGNHPIEVASVRAHHADALRSAGRMLEARSEIDSAIDAFEQVLAENLNGDPDSNGVRRVAAPAALAFLYNGYDGFSRGEGVNWLAVVGRYQQLLDERVELLSSLGDINAATGHAEIAAELSAAVGSFHLSTLVRKSKVAELHAQGGDTKKAIAGVMDIVNDLVVFHTEGHDEFRLSDHSTTSTPGSRFGTHLAPVLKTVAATEAVGDSGVQELLTDVVAKVGKVRSRDLGYFVSALGKGLSASGCYELAVSLQVQMAEEQLASVTGDDNVQEFNVDGAWRHLDDAVLLILGDRAPEAIALAEKVREFSAVPQESRRVANGRWESFVEVPEPLMLFAERTLAWASLFSDRKADIEAIASRTESEISDESIRQMGAFATVLFLGGTLSEGDYLDGGYGDRAGKESLYFFVGEHCRARGDRKGAVEAYRRGLLAGKKRDSNLTTACWSAIRLQQLGEDWRATARAAAAAEMPAHDLQ